MTKARFQKKNDETITENIFRAFYGPTQFSEKTAIPKSYGFRSKKGTQFAGYPDFFKEVGDYVIVVEAKPTDQDLACEEVKYYMSINKIDADIIGIAISGQKNTELKVNYFIRLSGEKSVATLEFENELLRIEDLTKVYRRAKYGETVSRDELQFTLKKLNKIFHDGNKVRDTDRSLFFAGLLIALTDDSFRATYKSIKAPSRLDKSTVMSVILEAHNLNRAILESIASQLETKINSLSKEFSWKDKFAFIKTIDYTLEEYKGIINIIEKKILVPFQNEEKQDILGRAYKLFLSRAGKVDSKNIILTPDHIKRLMVKLARLTKDDVVLDTCTGSGGFLMESMETMIYLAGGNPKKIADIKEKQLIGFEVDSVLFALACSNMFLHGDGRTNLLYRNSLLSGNNQEGIVASSDKGLLKYVKALKPTKCIINPPYEKNNPIRFTKQALEYLESNGKLVIIMPRPTLTHNQGGLTEEIFKIAKLDYVITMPTRLFSEQKRAVNTAIFGFTKTPHHKDDEVLFYNLEDDGHVSVQHKGRVDKDNKWSMIEHSVLDIIKNGKEIEGVCEKRKLYLASTLNCAGIRPKRDSAYSMVRVNDLFDIEKGTLASEEARDGEYAFITASEEWKTHDEFENDGEALVFAVAAAGSLGRSHYVNGKFVASNLCLVLTPKVKGGYKINLQFYKCYFDAIRKQLVADLADGTSKLTISPSDLGGYYIDYIPITKQNAFVKQNLTKVAEMQKTLRLEMEKIERNIQKII